MVFKLFYKIIFLTHLEIPNGPLHSHHSWGSLPRGEHGTERDPRIHLLSHILAHNDIFLCDCFHGVMCNCWLYSSRLIFCYDDKPPAVHCSRGSRFAQITSTWGLSIIRLLSYCSTSLLKFSSTITSCHSRRKRLGLNHCRLNACTSEWSIAIPTRIQLTKANFRALSKL